MNAVGLPELNQRYVRLTDRCRSQWTFYQLLLGIFKHLRQEPCPIEIDFQKLFSDLRDLGATLGHPQTGRTEKVLFQIGVKLDAQGRRLREVDSSIPPSLVRRFFDRLRQKDERVLLAIIKFYLEGDLVDVDVLDKLDILLTRLAEVPHEDGHAVPRERYEIERLLAPLLPHHRTPRTPVPESEILLHALGDLKAEVLASRRFQDLVAGGALDRLRTLKRRLGGDMLDARLLPALLETTVTVKNRFQDLWHQEEVALEADLRRLRELQAKMGGRGQKTTPELAQELESFAAAQHRFEESRRVEHWRREDLLRLRISLDRLLAHLNRDLGPSWQQEISTPFATPTPRGGEVVPFARTGAPRPDSGVSLRSDPLLQEQFNKIVYSLELLGGNLSPAELAQSRELAPMRLESFEIQAFRNLAGEEPAVRTLDYERDRLFAQAASLRLRMDDEAREIQRLHSEGLERLGVLLDQASQSLQRANEVERRFAWFIEDALYAGFTERLDQLNRARFRILRAYSGLWLVHNQCGGVSPF
jgi:hypothetical protein